MTMTNPEVVLSLKGLQQIASQHELPGQNTIWTSDPTIELPIKLGGARSPISSLAPVTIMQRLEATMNAAPDRAALCVKRGGHWKSWTYRQYVTDAKLFARAAISVGLGAHNCVSILGFNSPEWFLANIGSIYAGGIAAGIYTTNGPEACQYIIEHSKSVIVVVEDDVQLQKILKVRSQCKHLKAIVQYVGEPRVSDPSVYSWAKFLSLAKNTPETALNARIAAQRPGHCSTLIYTSGTTGNPKAVMLSHDNLTWTSSDIATHLLDWHGVLDEAQSIVSYLPLSHVAGQMTDMYVPMFVGGTVWFAQPDALKGTLVDTLRDVRPHYFFGVPRVWEKFEDKIKEVGAQNTGVKKALGDWAKKVGLEGNFNRMDGKDVPWGWGVADRVVFHNIKKNLGLERTVMCLSGAAPISQTTVEYFMSLNIPIYEVYGMSESSGPHTVNRIGPKRARVGTVGQLFAGMETKLDNPDKDGNGEICMRGRHVFMGYLFNPEATASTIDKDGWLHSGDLGKHDDDMFLKITGRIKELIITAGGENVPPVLIEDSIKAELPAISNVVVLGEKQRYLACLITLKSEPDSEGQPTDKLAAPTQALVQDAGSSATGLAQALTCPKVKAKVEEAIGRANMKATSNAQKIRKWEFLPGDFTIAGGELTATMKLKRRVVNDKYANVITRLFPHEEPAVLSKL